MAITNTTSVSPTTQWQPEIAGESTKQTRVFLVDDHEVVRRGLRMIFVNDGDIVIVGEADGKDHDALLKNIETTQPDIVLMDIRLDGMDGFELSTQIKISRPKTKVIMLTGYESELYASEALFHRVNGFITKESSKDFICTAIRMVALGGSVWQGDILFHAIKSWAHTNPSSTPNTPTNNFKPINNLKDRLTSREIQVLIALGQGLSNKDISKRFNLPELIVKKTVHNIFCKIGVSNRTQAALFAQKSGLE
ncbi:DNA-binding response regulator LuxR family [Dehalogenimonas sp. WBC-2]|nr:DNA-binding response regulator LuxR family [Dehalogenimonas sp. WBC-2]